MYSTMVEICKHAMEHVSAHSIAVSLVCSHGDEIGNNFLAVGKNSELKWCITLGGLLLESLGSNRKNVLDESHIFGTVFGITFWAHISAWS